MPKETFTPSKYLKYFLMQLQLIFIYFYLPVSYITYYSMQFQLYLFCLQHKGSAQMFRGYLLWEKTFIFYIIYR